MLNNYTFGCHGIPERCYKFKGVQMPFCARCLGTAIGHVISLFQFIFFPLWSVWFALIGLCIMLLDWYLQNQVKLYHSNSLRLVTGLFGGYSVGLLIWTCVQTIYSLFVD